MIAQGSICGVRCNLWRKMVVATIVCLGVMLMLQAEILLAQATQSARSRVNEVAAEHQPVADLGNGAFRNPILSGNYADNAVVRVGADYYMVHCCASARGMLVWHSRDLVNWAPYSIVKVPIKGTIWAPDLDFIDGTFYLYLPMMSPGTGTVWAMTATSMKGPWSDPVDLGVSGIDPGLVVGPDGEKYLYVDAGRVVSLTSDGLKVNGQLKKIYDGWRFPDDWNVQCFCLESPKLIHHGQYYYLISAEGGTDGPSTSHMAAVARATSPTGPWENSPYNPLVHTFSRSERWWSQGHGVLIDDTDGNWWMIYHAIENGYQSLGRETLLMPVSWTPDGWPAIKDDLPSTAILRKPVGSDVGDGMPLSDEFNDQQLGLQWSYTDIPSSRVGVHPGNRELRLDADGTTPSNAPMLWIEPVNHAYEAQVEVQAPAKGAAGLVFAEGEGDPGITGGMLKKGELELYALGRLQLTVPWDGDHVYFRLADLEHDISVYYSKDGTSWNRFDFGVEFDGLSNVRVGLVAVGQGSAVFRHFAYHGLDSIGHPAL